MTRSAVTAGRGRAAVSRLVAAVLVAVTAVLVAAAPARADTAGAPADPAAAEPNACGGPADRNDSRCDRVPVPAPTAAEESDGPFGGSIGDRVADAVLETLARWLVGAARWAVSKLFDNINALTTPDLGAAWLSGHLLRVGQISLIWLALVYLAATVDAAVRARPDVLVRAVGVTPLAVAGSAVGVFVLELLTAGFDESAAWLMDAASDDLAAFSERLGVGLALSDLDQALFVGVLVSVAVALAAVVVWIELLMREIALYLAASFIPLAVAGTVWPATGSRGWHAWRSRWRRGSSSSCPR
jgi:hypothetical protein